MPPDDDPDTIIVKGEQWSHPSTPSSTASFTGPPSTNLLAQSSDIPQHLESPEPLDDDIPPRPDHPDFPQQTPRRYKKESATMEERLQSMLEKRKLPWRHGVEAGAEIETGGESRRKQIRFGCLLATRGEVADPPCLSCANGRGKFALCVALEGYFKGACASCQLSGRPNRCSIKLVGDDPTQSPPNNNAETPGADHLSTIQQRPSPAVLSSSGGPPPAKRKRIGANHGGMPEWENSRPQWEQELGDSHARLQQANEIIHHAPRPILHPQQAQAQAQAHAQRVHRHHMAGQQAQMQQHGQRSWAPVNAPVSSQPAQMAQPQHNNGPPISRTASGGWAAVNQRPEPRRIYSTDSNGVEITNNSSNVPGNMNGNGIGPRIGPRISMENGNGIGGGVMTGNPNGMRHSVDMYREDTLQEDGSTAAPMIDMLPKSKQRQVYGLISGLQGGIEHLQRELVALKQALGIDDED